METTQETLQSKAVSLLDTDTRHKIRTLWLEGKQVNEIQGIMNVPKGTWDVYYYENRNLFRDFILSVKRDAMIQSAERVSAEIVALPNDNARIVAIKQKEAEFIRETQGKELGYTKRAEVVGIINNQTPLDNEQKAKLDKMLKVKRDDVIDVKLDKVE